MNPATDTVDQLIGRLQWFSDHGYGDTPVFIWPPDRVPLQAVTGVDTETVRAEPAWQPNDRYEPDYFLADSTEDGAFTAILIG